MKKFLFLILFMSQTLFASQVTLVDTECQVMGGKDNINISEGTLANYLCKSINEQQVECIYFDINGNQINEKEKYNIIVDDNKNFSIWISTSGNISILFDYKNLKYSMAMTGFSSKHIVLANKYCIGTFIKNYNEK